MKLAKRLGIPATATGRVHDLALQKKKEGKKVFNFSAGDIALPIHPLVEKGIQESMKKAKGIVNYPPVAGLTELRELAASWMQRRYGACYDQTQTLVTNGGKFAIYALAQALLDVGDQVMVVNPYWVSYLPIIELCQAQPCVIATTEQSGWKVTIDELDRRLDARTKMLILNNASNPTGILYSSHEIEEILIWARKNHVFVLSDEVYSELVYDQHHYVSCAAFPEFCEHVAIVESCSKNFGMTGWRVGFTFASVPIINAMSKLQGQTTTGTSLVSQWAALAALQHAQVIATDLCQQMCERRNLFVETWNRLFQTKIIPPASAIYQFVGLKALAIHSNNSSQFCERAMEEVCVAMVPGCAFGQEGYVRFAFSETPDQIVEGLELLAQFCKEQL